MRMREGLERSELVAVGVGGAIGAGVRYGITELLLEDRPRLGLLVVNTIGCLVIGAAAAHLGRDRDPAHNPKVHPFVIGGVCGGITTLSAVALDAAQVMRQGASAGDVGFLAFMIGIAMAAVLLGRVATQRLTPSQR